MFSEKDEHSARSHGSLSGFWDTGASQQVSCLKAVSKEILAGDQTSNLQT
jgi:hypothetical protein